MKLSLMRISDDGEATLGRLAASTPGAQWACSTLELPDRGNVHQISCVPAGTYKTAWRDSPKFGRVLRLLDVPDREGILIHAGNTPLDTHGCILVGLAHGTLNGLPAVLRSRAALAQLSRFLKNSTPEIEIIGVGDD